MLELAELIAANTMLRHTPGQQINIALGAEKMEADPGFEPGYSDSKSDVLTAILIRRCPFAIPINHIHADFMVLCAINPSTSPSPQTSRAYVLYRPL